MSFISRLSNTQKLLAAVALAMVIIAGITMLMSNQRTAEQQGANTVTPEQQKQRDKNDKLKQDRMASILNAVNYTYVTKKQAFPPATEGGWADILNTVSLTDSFYDPYTNTIFAFTETDPDFGEIQYGPGKACSKDNKLLGGFGDGSLALRTKLSDGFYCVTNYQGEDAS